MRRGSALIPPSLAPKKFPDQLGPFGVRRTTFTRLHFAYITAEEGFELKANAFHSPTLAKLQSILQSHPTGLPIRGKMSPVNKITLDEHARSKASIPREAVSFAWGYPTGLPHEVLLKSPHVDELMSDPDISLLLIGGFFYFDADDELIAINTLVRAAEGGLQFSEPKVWDSTFTGPLWRASRFQQITIKALSDEGAHYFAWILPGEVLVDDFGDTHVFSEHGCFVYIFHADIYDGATDELEKDRYFEVLGGDEYKASNENFKRRVSATRPELHRIASPSYRVVYLQGRMMELKRLQEETPSLNTSNRHASAQMSTWNLDQFHAWLDDEGFHGLIDVFSSQGLSSREICGSSSQRLRNTLQQVAPNVLQLIVAEQLQRAISRMANVQHNTAYQLQNEKIGELQQELVEAKLCVVCFGNEKNQLFQPCGHAACCRDCAQRIMEADPRCILCTKVVETVEGFSFAAR